MPGKDEELHNPMARLFMGQFGEDIFHNVTVAGKRQRDVCTMEAYLGFYPDKQFHLVRLTAWQITLPRAVRGIRRYRFTREEAARQYTQVVAARRGATIDEVDPILWNLAHVQIQPLGLPLAFFSYLTTQWNGESKVVFWYLRMVPGPWMLDQVQRQPDHGSLRANQRTGSPRRGED